MEVDSVPINYLSPGSSDVLTFPKDQCVFLSYYKIKYRILLPKKIRANADPPFLGRDDNAHDGDSGPLSAMYADVEQETKSLSVRLSAS